MGKKFKNVSNSEEVAFSGATLVTMVLGNSSEIYQCYYEGSNDEFEPWDAFVKPGPELKAFDILMAQFSGSKLYT